MSNISAEPIAKRLLLLANVLNSASVRIDKLVVPEMVAADCFSAVLDCVYGGAGDDVTVWWLYNGARVYEWRQGAEPTASAPLDQRIDLSYRVKDAEGNRVQRRALRLLDLSPDVSGEYTCVVRSRGQEARLAKTMIVYSPEKDFELSFSELDHDMIAINCTAKRLYPQPELILEYKGSAIVQQQRVWREGRYFDAECRATLRRAPGQLSCRVRIPQVEYTAITKKYLGIAKPRNWAAVTNKSYSIFICLTYLAVIGQLTLN